MTVAPARPTFAASAAATYATNVAVAALSLLNVLVVARALGPDGRGQVAFLTTVAVLTSSLATLGVEEATANFAAAQPGSRRRLAGNAAAFALVAGAGAAGLVGALLALFPAAAAGVDATLLAATLAAIPPVLLGVLLRSLAQADYRFAVTNAAWLMPPVAQVIVNGALAAAGELTVGIAIGSWIGGQLAASAFLAWYVARRLAGFGAPHAATATASLAFGAKAHLGRVLTLGNYRLDQWLVAGIAGTRELGLYSVAVAWAEALFFLPTALATVLRPDLVRDDAGAASARAAATARVALGLTALLALVLVVAAPVLCVTVFGEDFRGAADDLRVLAVGAGGIVLLKLLGTALTARRRPLAASAAVAVAFVVTVALDLLLIPELGGLGAAIASTAAYTAGGVAVVLVFTRVTRVSALALVPRPSDAGAVRAGFRRRRAGDEGGR